MPDFSLAILIIKYVIAAAIVWCVWMFPAYLARQNGQSGLEMANVRIASWLFGWTVIGWMFAVYLAAKSDK